MKFNNHSQLEGTHAVLSASQHAWLRYTDEHFIEVFTNKRAAALGTELHDYAHKAILLKRRQPTGKHSDSVSQFVNDAIGFKMRSEQVLYYSPFIYGTADAISYRKINLRDKSDKARHILRVHDLKTGVNPCSMDQLKIYAALFCLEYHQDPYEMDIELRIYQNGEIIYHIPSSDEIRVVMDKVIHANNLITEMYNTQEDN